MKEGTELSFKYLDIPTCFPFSRITRRFPRKKEFRFILHPSAFILSESQL